METNNKFINNSDPTKPINLDEVSLEKHRTTKLAEQEFKEKLNNIFPNYESKEKYTNYRTKLLVSCKLHNNTFLANPHSMLIEKKEQCPECRKNLRLNNIKNNFIKKLSLNKHFDTSKVSILDDKTIINIKCNNCNKYFSIKNIWNFLSKELCPNCNSLSSGEIFVINWLDKYKINYKKHVRFPNSEIIGKTDKSGVEIDFIIENYNNKIYWIEYNGEQHYNWCKHFQDLEKFNGQLRRDNNIKEYCKKNNIIFIEIPWTYNTQSKVDKLLIDEIINNNFNNLLIPKINYNR